MNYNSCRATFADIVNFIEKQVKIATDPVFGDILDTPVPPTGKDTKTFKSQPRYGVKRSNFATTISAVEKVETGTALDKRTCFFCNGEHELELCPLFEKRAHDEKIDFLRKSGRCFSCLCIGHISKDCRQRLTCEVCHLKHPGILHIYKRERGKQPDQPLEEPRSRVTISIQTSGLTGAGELNCKLSIVPVQIKAKKGHKIIQTYAFLDQGSTASFCTVSLMNKLNLSGRRTRILLRTMGQEKIVDSYIIADLEVAAL